MLSTTQYALGTLECLPQEMRDHVYAYVIESDNNCLEDSPNNTSLQMLRVSKIVRTEFFKALQDAHTMFNISSTVFVDTNDLIDLGHIPHTIKANPVTVWLTITMGCHGPKEIREIKHQLKGLHKFFSAWRKPTYLALEIETPFRIPNPRTHPVFGAYDVDFWRQVFGHPLFNCLKLYMPSLQYLSLGLDDLEEDEIEWYPGQNWTADMRRALENDLYNFSEDHAAKWHFVDDLRLLS